VAVHSGIYELEHGVLLVEADHPGWVQTLQTKQKELLLTVQKKYPELKIQGIAFRLARKPSNSPAEPRTVYEKKIAVENQNCDFESDEPVSELFDVSSRSDDFYAALKELEKSVKKRNRNK
jgi:hypothetical protein